MGRTIEEALERARQPERQGYRHSYDMLGESARTAADARRYFDSYGAAIAAIGKAVAGRSVIEAPGISVKLSALHPRYEEAQRERALRELLPALAALAAQAKASGIGFTIDAEESERLDLSLDIIEGLAGDPALAGWQGLGLAIQAYQKRALPLVDFLAATARRTGRRLMVRLVKGAYWDSEIKRSQERGLAGYPVFTRKVATDVSYIACAKRLIAAPDAFYPQFATHNAHTVATIVELAGNRSEFEFQRLHGMGEALYEQIVGADKMNRPCRVYAPVGSHEDLLAYLVRRLLENGANTSFVNRIVDEKAPLDEIIADPIARLRRLPQKPHPRIPLPVDLYGPERSNARGLDLSDPLLLARLSADMESAARQPFQAAPIVGGSERTGPSRDVADPADRRRIIGTIVEADAAQTGEALLRAARAAPLWDETDAAARAAMLERAADLMEERMPVLFACISPWNFPLAIFTGQIAAALAAGNAVIAKPAEQTPLIAAAAIRILHEAGIPGDVLHLLPGGGEVGARLVGDPRIAGIAFTGSTETARAINEVLARRPGPIVPLIAETGGQNALIVDSSALAEQVVGDVIASSFNSAGQRCSALRVLFVQTDIADRVLAMLAGAMRELVIGDPALLATDIGPVIDEAAHEMLEAHAARMESEAKKIYQLDLPPDIANGIFFAPRAFEIDRLDRLEREIFGPILHVVRWRGDQLDQVLDQIAATCYGLTLGIHSRIDETVRAIERRVRVGNLYVNRNMIGAVVGVQPFGGEGLSGTGPKAGGPHYLHRFAVERTVSVDTTASGGNASLLSLQEEG